MTLTFSSLLFFAYLFFFLFFKSYLFQFALTGNSFEFKNSVAIWDVSLVLASLRVTKLDRALGKLIQLKTSLLTAGGLDTVTSRHCGLLRSRTEMAMCCLAAAHL